MSRLELRLLGAPQVERAGHPIKFPTRKAAALLIYLAVEGGRHSRERLTALFWPESDAAHGRAALRSTLGYLRAALEGGDPPLLAEHDALSVRAGACALDLEPFAAAASAAATAPPTPAARAALLAQLQEAAAL